MFFMPESTSSASSLPTEAKRPAGRPPDLVSHVPVLHVLPVHQHVVPAERPHLAVSRHDVALELVAAVSVHQRGGDAVDAVVREAGHRLSVGGRQVGSLVRSRIRYRSDSGSKRSKA